MTGNIMAGDTQKFPQNAGFHDFQFKSSVGEMDLSLVLPAQINSATSLILVLHYAGQPTRFYGRPLLENLVAPAFSTVESEFSAIFVAPTSLGGDWRAPDNIVAVFEAINELEQHYGTNPARRVVTGYSMGAVGSWFLQSEKPGFFSGAIPIAGYPTSAAVDCQIPVYAIMSDADEVFPLAPFQNLVETLQQNDCPVSSQIISGIGHYDIGGFQTAVSNAASWLAKMWRADR